MDRRDQDGPGGSHSTAPGESGGTPDGSVRYRTLLAGSKAVAGEAGSRG
jgi:hypothetical protein